MTHSHREPLLSPENNPDIENPVPVPVSEVKSTIQSLDDDAPKELKAETPIIQPSSNLENLEEMKGGNQPVQILTDSEIYEKLTNLKISLGSWNTTAFVIDGNGCPAYTSCASTSIVLGVLGILFGGAMSIGAAVDPNFGLSTDARIVFGVLTAAGIASSIANLTFCFSSKCRAYTMGKINKPIPLPYQIDELNLLLKNVGIDRVDATKILTTKDLVALTPTIDAAIALTDAGKQFLIGLEVKSTLLRFGIFTHGTRLVLEYLNINKTDLDKIATAPPLQVKKT